MFRAFIFLPAVLAVSLPLAASEIRLSMLNDERVLNETATLLRTNGCSLESVEAFKKAVRFHKADLFNTSKLPEPVAGSYSFKDVAELDHAIPDPFCTAENDKWKDGNPVTDLNHNSLVCLDIVVLLIKDTGAKAPRLKADFASKHFAKQRTIKNSDPIAFRLESASSPDFYKDGRTLLYPADGYTYITDLDRTTNEVDLAISLKGERQLPGKFEDNDAAIKSLFTDWTKLRERDGLQFPPKIAVVSGGYIPMKYHYWAIDHVAVCFNHQGKLIYIEKNGSCGPFLRIDFNNEEELGQFVADNKLLPPSRDPKEINFGAPVFVAINDRLIRIARP